MMLTLRADHASRLAFLHARKARVRRRSDRLDRFASIRCASALGLICLHRRHLQRVKNRHNRAGAACNPSFAHRHNLVQRHFRHLGDQPRLKFCVLLQRRGAATPLVLPRHLQSFQSGAASKSPLRRDCAHCVRQRRAGTHQSQQRGYASRSNPASALLAPPEANQSKAESLIDKAL